MLADVNLQGSHSERVTVKALLIQSLHSVTRTHCVKPSSQLFLSQVFYEQLKRSWSNWLFIQIFCVAVKAFILFSIPKWKTGTLSPLGREMPLPHDLAYLPAESSETAMLLIKPTLFSQLFWSDKDDNWPGLEWGWNVYSLGFVLLSALSALSCLIHPTKPPHSLIYRGDLWRTVSKVAHMYIFNFLILIMRHWYKYIVWVM